jgi:hypothetical protein
VRSISANISNSTLPRPAINFADVEQQIATADYMPYQEFLETRFYKACSRR